MRTCKVQTLVGEPMVRVTIGCTCTQQRVQAEAVPVTVAAAKATATMTRAAVAEEVGAVILPEERDAPMYSEWMQSSAPETQELQLRNVVHILSNAGFPCQRALAIYTWQPLVPPHKAGYAQVRPASARC